MVWQSIVVVSHKKQKYLHKQKWCDMPKPLAINFIFFLTLQKYVINHELAKNKYRLPIGSTINTTTYWLLWSRLRQIPMEPNIDHDMDCRSFYFVSSFKVLLHCDGLEMGTQLTTFSLVCSTINKFCSTLKKYPSKRICLFTHQTIDNHTSNLNMKTSANTSWKQLVEHEVAWSCQMREQSHNHRCKVFMDDQS